MENEEFIKGILCPVIKERLGEERVAKYNLTIY